MTKPAWILLLAVAAGCATTPSTPPPAPTALPVPDAPVATPTPTPIATPGPTGPPPEAAPQAVLFDAPIRVMLKKTSGEIDLPQPGRPYRVGTGGRAVWLWGPLKITASAESAWQVGAWSDGKTAASVAERLAGLLGEGARVWREPAGNGLVRVRVRWPAGSPSDAAALLAEAGFDQAIPVSGAGTVRVAGVASAVESAGEVLVTPSGDWPTVVGNRRYRGVFRLRLGGDQLLVVNELGLEDYLRGVVPVEMGPYQFPELEALKAQAIAARTYAVAHLGDHDDEGWDICATPACQAYHGSGAEHSLSDRAIEETRGLIATYRDEPIDAMYTSTCGGHTEDSTELFSGRSQPYLKGVACVWDRPILLAGEGPAEPIGDGSEFRRLLARRALGLGAGDVDPRALLPAVAGLAGGEVLPLPEKPELAPWVEALFAAAGLDETSPLVGGEGAGRLVRLANLFDIELPTTTPSSWRYGWHLEAVTAVLELQGVIRRDGGEAVPRPEGAGIYPRRADASEPLTQPLPLVWRWDGRFGSATALRVLPGTTLERYRLGDRILALVVVQSDGGGEADRRSSWRSWSRDRSWDELAQRLGTRDLDRIEVRRRGRSGRVVSLAVIDSQGRRRLVEGFEIRRVLDLPETLFQMHIRTLPDGERTVRFLGRGWGHGVGLCQNGAYGLARAGMDFEKILKHYYTGIEIVPWSF